MRVYFAILLILINHVAYASNVIPKYYQQNAIGWHWYHNRKTKKKVDLTKVNIREKIIEIQKIQNPSQRMAAIHHLLKATLDRAILEPNLENITQYIVLQNQVSKQASLFRETWQQALLNSPKLNFNIKHPTSQWANSAYQIQNHSRATQEIRHFGKTHGLFFFYRGTCPHCQHFAPVLKSFSRLYHLHIIPVSLDGVKLPEFPNSRLNQGQAEWLKVTEVPALFAVNPKTQQIISLGAGDRTEDQLRKDILIAIHYYKQKEANS